MQRRMREYQLDRDKIDQLLLKSSTGHLGTLGPDGYPYVTPVHYVYLDGSIFIHGNPRGTKIDNLKVNPKVSFEVMSDGGLIMADAACDTNTRFESVIIAGHARVLDNKDAIAKILMEFVKKYTPGHIDEALPPEMVRMTGIIVIDIVRITGKYYS
jgi:nitroimidazol reductase NimA-like FMN-containing flavoprotein (pyridoxamine 5'-phosphate oxidase superfamily)